MVNRIFDKKNVILLKVNEDDLNTFFFNMLCFDKEALVCSTTV